MGTIENFESFENYLKDGLVHLYDPGYQPPDLVWKVLGLYPQQGVEELQKKLIEAIAALKPSPDIPPNARIRRLYRLLSYRYIQEFTQVDVARQLNISLRHLRREQQQAVRVLAHRLWEQQTVVQPDSTPAQTEAEAFQPAGDLEPDTQPDSWRSQVRQELNSLEQHAPGAVADVGPAMQSAIKVGQSLVARQPITLHAKLNEPDLRVAIHPSLLSQILVTAIDKLVQNMSSPGEIRLAAESGPQQIKFSITGKPIIATGAQQSDLISEIVMTQNGAFEVMQNDDSVEYQIALPVARTVKVLVVDDNKDLVHWYRRYTARTKYQITHLPEGKQVFETTAGLEPDIIVLDVMLPDIDGWELLTRLHESPETRNIPVVICSVVKREALALALGAAVYLPKPVRRQQLIQALDQALDWGSKRASNIEANIAVTG